MALETTDPPPIKRGRGRPPKIRPPTDQEPPAKKRKYVTRTPTLPHREPSFEHDTINVNHSDVVPSDPEHLQSAIKSDMHDSPGIFEENAVSPKTMRARTHTSRPRRSYAPARSRGPSSATPRPRYSSAAAAAAASQASDGYKPREERSWEEFHPDLHIEAELMVYTADEVDGRTRPPFGSIDGISQSTGLGIANAITDNLLAIPQEQFLSPVTVKRRPGRPPRRPESMLSGLGSPPAPRILPLPIHNPKERLNLPKPSYRQVETFKTYEENKKVRVEDYVDKSMAHVGYQESELFDIPKRFLLRHSEAAYDDDLGAALTLASDHVEGHSAPHQIGGVEYDMDEQDERWLETINTHRKTDGVEPIKPSMFEIALTQIEREFYALEKRKSSSKQHCRTPS